MMPTSSREMQLGRYSWRSEEAHRSTDGHGLEEDSAQEVVRPFSYSLFSMIGPECGDMVCRYNIYKDHITLADYEIHDGMSLEMY